MTRTDPDDREDPYRIPSYHLLNAGVSWSGHIRKLGLVLFLNVNNILDSCYIERGKDGSTHASDSFTGYWADGRNLNFGLRLVL